MELKDKIGQQRADYKAKIKTILDLCTEEHRDLSDAEQANHDEYQAQIDVLDQRLAQIVEQEEREARAAEAMRKLAAAGDAENAEAEDGQRRTVPASPNREERWAAAVNHRGEQVQELTHVGGDPLVYSRATAHEGVSFLQDWMTWSGHPAGSGDVSAVSDRVERHKRQSYARPVNASLESRDANAASFAGLVVPQYLTDLADTAVRSMRPTADAMNMRPLPPTGMTIEVPRITTGATAAGTAELAAGSETDIVASNLTLNVKTVRGVADISYEAIERGVMVDDLAIQDLAEAVATQVNDDVINGSSASQVAGLLKSGTLASGNLKTDADSGSPSAALVYSHTVDLATTLSTGRYVRATHFVMAPRRFGYLAKATDGDGRPLYQAAAMTATNIYAVGDQVGAVGGSDVMIAGVPVIVDPAVPANAGSNSQ